MEFREKYDFDALTTYKLFFWVPICKATQKGNTTIFKCFGIPVWMVRETAGESKNFVIRKHYFLGIPIAKTVDDTEYSGDDCEDSDEI